MNLWTIKCAIIFGIIFYWLYHHIHFFTHHITHICGKWYISNYSEKKKILEHSKYKDTCRNYISNMFECHKFLQLLCVPSNPKSKGRSLQNMVQDWSIPQGAGEEAQARRKIVIVWRFSCCGFRKAFTWGTKCSTYCWEGASAHLESCTIFKHFFLLCYNLVRPK